MVWAAVSILIAGIFDVFDGRVARLTGGTSEFGVQYDSLCDLVSFGVAPAFIMYQSGLNEFGRVGWIACFVFLACGALRLARFNVQSSIGKASGDFTGLPIPMAAGYIASCVIAVLDTRTMTPKGSVLETIHGYVLDPWYTSVFFLFSGPLLGILMVSNINFRSHKTLKVKGVTPFKLLVAAVALIGLVAIYPEILGFMFFLIYAFSGPVERVLGGKKALDDDEIFDVPEDEVGQDQPPGGVP